jgi:8-oxo-dGTP pyrophosphatase MutT (NUDIX family)
MAEAYLGERISVERAFHMPSMTSGRWLGARDEALGSMTDLQMSRHAIEEFVPSGNEQTMHRKAVLEFIDQHPDALHRSCLVGHLTASSWVVNHRGDRGLIMYHSKIQMWVQPGGHADGDANLAAVALKEASEETGISGLEVYTAPIDIDIHLFVNKKNSEADHLHHDLRYLVRAPEGAVEFGNHESEALRWVSEDELRLRELDLDESTIRLAKSGFAAVRGIG